MNTRSPFLLAIMASLLCSLASTAYAQPVEDAPLLEDLDEALEALEDEVEDGEDTPKKETKEEKKDNRSLLVAEFGLDERNVVLSAAKTQTTIQEAPAIVSVITAKEIRSRGYRTVNEVLQSIPGFEGDRWDSNGWTEESFARGNPRTLLVLLNGVSINEPARNVTSLDRKLPLEAIKRIEVVSGPGGVLWGSNALLGVVNIITRDADDLDGFEVFVGGGTGRGEVEAAKVAASYGGKFAADKVKVFSHLSFFTTRSAELEVDSQKIVGVLPAPADDGVSFFLPESATTDPEREFFLNWSGKASWGDVTLEWMLPWEDDGRQLGTGGALLSNDVRTDKSTKAFDVNIKSADSIRIGALSYKSRFFGESFGLGAKVFYTNWELKETPFGAFPPSNLSPRVERGLFTRLESLGQERYGLNVDMDVQLPADNFLIFGGEVFQDDLKGVETSSPITEDLIATLSESQRANLSNEDGVPFYTEKVVKPVSRLIGALYLRNEWKANAKLAISGGSRLQVSDAYDPALLFSGAAVLNLFGETFLKLNYAEGFRPPSLQSTDGNSEAINQLTYQSNPNLKVEKSRAIETELNTAVKGTGIIDRLYLRGDYSLSFLEDIIEISGGRFENTGSRLIHSAEALGRLEFVGEHELWASYYFVHVDDDEIGELRQIANHIVNAGGRVMLWPELWELNAQLTWIGPREDRNRNVDPDRERVSGFVPVYPSDLIIDELDPVWLLRIGTRVIDLWDTVTLSAFSYNTLDVQWYDPDLFFDDRVATRPYPKPGFSFFLQAEAKF